MMENQNSQIGPISKGAMVEATDGLVGTVVETIMNLQTNELLNLIVQNDNQNKQFTIPANLIDHQVGTQVIHLKVSGEDLLNSGATLEVDTNTANFGHPNPPMPQ
jgi:hypothetical protein